METVQKLREGVFLINWNVGINQGTYHNQQYIRKSSVDIKEISTSFELTCSQPAYTNDNSVLQLIIKRNVPLVHSTVEPRVNSLKLQTAIDLQTKAKNTVPEVLEPSSVVVIVNGKSHVMQLIENSTWNTEFNKTSLCGCGGSKWIFNVFIDFNSTSIITETKQVKEHLLNLWETKTLTDVTFKFKEKEVKAHTLIVASGSPVLAAMFQNDFKEKQERVVVIKDSSSIVFEKMLHFFYTGDPGLDDENVSDLLVVANKYESDSLKEECALYMAKNLTVDNVIRYLVVAHLNESPNFYESALEFISQNCEEIVTKKDWLDLMKNYHELSLAAVQIWFWQRKEC